MIIITTITVVNLQIQAFGIWAMSLESINVSQTARGQTYVCKTFEEHGEPHLVGMSV